MRGKLSGVNSSGRAPSLPRIVPSASSAADAPTDTDYEYTSLGPAALDAIKVLEFSRICEMVRYSQDTVFPRLISHPNHTKVHRTIH